MKVLPFLLVAVLTLTLWSCNIIDNPIQAPQEPTDTGQDVKQNVLIEDYTGHTCGNCPEAADVAHQIQTTYGSDRVIVVAVHAGPFATPIPPEYPTNWACPEGEELDKTFRISRAGNPNGLVNRTTYNGKFIQSKDNWAPVTVDLLAESPLLDIKASPTWNSTTKSVSLSVDVKYLAEGTEDYYLCAWIIENGLVGDQTDYRVSPSHVTNYKFEHVLRGTLNGTWGEQLSATPVAKGTTITKQINYTFPDGKTWNPDNCELVVFVHRYGATKNVVQVVKTKLTSK